NFVANDDKGVAGVYRLDLTSGKESVDPRFAGIPPRGTPHFTESDSSLYTLKATDSTPSMRGRANVLLVGRLGSSDVRTLYTAPALKAIDGPIAISPDGKTAVLSLGDHAKEWGTSADFKHRIIVLSTETGERRELLSPEAITGDRAMPREFTPDGRSFLMSTRMPDNGVESRVSGQVRLWPRLPPPRQGARSRPGPDPRGGRSCACDPRRSKASHHRRHRSQRVVDARRSTPLRVDRAHDRLAKKK